MLSNASDPQMRVAIQAPWDAPTGAAVSGIEDLDGVAGNAVVAGVEHDLQRRLGAWLQHARRTEVGRRKCPSRHEAPVAVGQAQVDRWRGERHSAAAAQRYRENEGVEANRTRERRAFDRHIVNATWRLDPATGAPAPGSQRRLQDRGA